MPNKRKCKGCEEFYLPSIGEEGKVNQPPWVKWCSDDCRETVALNILRVQREKAKAAIKRKAKKKKKKESKQKREFYDGDVKTRKAAAKFWCHKYIRYRDRNERCICCGLPLGDDFQAGHCLPSGQNSNLRYNEDNINGQRLQCNYYRGGDSGDYEKNLRMKIGDKRVDYLLANAGGVVKRTADDYRSIENEYKEKLKVLQEQC